MIWTRLWFLVAWMLGVNALATPTEATGREIEQLLALVAALDGATFIRNGSEHTAEQAAAHLRLKRERQSGSIKSAEDFIERCGTKSTASGARYRMRFKDGVEKDSAEVLRQMLAEIRKGTPPP